jgi:hypothetical protein
MATQQMGRKVLNNNCTSDQQYKIVAEYWAMAAKTQICRARNLELPLTWMLLNGRIKKSMQSFMQAAYPQYWKEKK